MSATPFEPATYWASRPKLVILRPLGLGDFLTSVPALRALARSFPHHARLLAAPARLAPLAALTDAVDAVIPSMPLAPLDRRLHGAAIGVDLHGRGPLSQRILLASGVSRLIAFRHDGIPESRLQPAWDETEHEVVRWCRLLCENGISADPNDLDIERPSNSHAGRARFATLLHPGAASAARRWPANRWAQIARFEKSRGRRVLITGSAEERELCRNIARLAEIGDRDVLAGETNLAELAALVAAAGRVVCGDTGVAHLATAFRTPSVLLFGPTSPQRWGPLRNPHLHTVLWKGTAGDPHGAETDAGLLSISAEEVMHALAAPAPRVEPAARRERALTCRPLPLSPIAG